METHLQLITAEGEGQKVEFKERPNRLERMPVNAGLLARRMRRSTWVSVMTPLFVRYKY